MKKILLLVLLFASLLAAPEANARIVSVEEAFAAVQSDFSERDVDYYCLDSTDPLSKAFWYFFVDAEPMKGWGHECYLYRVLKSTTVVDGRIPMQVQPLSMPPNLKFMPYMVKNRYGGNATLKPRVKKSIQTNGEDDVAQRTYAVILSGGIRPYSNHERYWNDCSFIYQTLVNKYGVPRENIYPIMSDGNDPGADMNPAKGGALISQPLDLDGDGTDDIEMAATKENVSNTLATLANKLNTDDHLLLFVIDHGGSNDNDNSSYICLWKGEQLQDTELAEMLEPFTEKYVNVNVVLGQCNAGGFVDDLTKVGCVVSAACKGDESSYSCPDKPFDEFVYHWTCAVNEATHNGTPVISDTDNNGRVTMEEAFAYAKKNDRRNEQPQYVSTPLSVGEDLAFNYLAPAVDLYIKDNPEDTGKEPNMTTDKFWLSPSIWVRNQDDGIYEPENPYYSSNHLASIIYVRVHNRGKADYVADKKKYIHMYWAKASTGFIPSVWDGDETLSGGEASGGHLDPSSIKSPILAGDSLDVKITWALPADLLGNPDDNYTEKHHFCLLAQISNSSSNPAKLDSWKCDTRGSNKMAQLNVSIIKKEDLNSETNVYIRNTTDTDHKYTLELVPRTSEDELIYSQAAIEMKMSPTVYTAWENGGCNGNNIFHAPSANSRIVQFTSKDSKLETIALTENTFDRVSLKFNFKRISALNKKYTLDLIQRDENGNIIGGETFIVECPRMMVVGPGIQQTPASDNNVTLSMDVDDSTTVRWENAEGFTIGNGKEITVTPTNLESSYYAYALSDNGELSRDVTTIAGTSIISELNISNKELNISLQNDVPDGASVQIASALTGEMEITQPIEPGEKNIGVDISQLRTGIHLVSISVDGKIIENRKFTK